jgi:hypothetical protein
MIVFNYVTFALGQSDGDDNDDDDNDGDDTFKRVLLLLLLLIRKLDQKMACSGLTILSIY